MPPKFSLLPHNITFPYPDSYPQDNWGIREMEIDTIWEATKGEGIRIAVLDGGIGIDHPQFEDYVDISNTSQFKNLTVSASINDSYGHGTNCAGIAGARNTNGLKIGVAPQSVLLIGKIALSFEIGNLTWLLNGLTWAEQNGADIISLSLGKREKDLLVPTIRDRISQLIANRVFVICAAGSRRKMYYPADFEDTIAVGAIDKDGSVDPHDAPRGANLNVVAPGIMVYSSHANREYAPCSGTSIAAPFLAGVTALLLSKQKRQGTPPKLTHQDDLKALLKDTSRRVGIGNDDRYGWGIIDPIEMINSI